MYSLVKNVVRVDLYDTNSEADIHINQQLIDDGFAVFQEESHASRVMKQTAINSRCIKGNLGGKAV